jgi:hypothetical protein
MGKTFNLPPFVGDKMVEKYSLLCGLTTLVGKKFIDSCSLGLRQMAAKLYHFAAWNKAYKDIPSLLLPRPPRGRHTSLPPTLPRPSSVQKKRYSALNFFLPARETENKN